MTYKPLASPDTAPDDARRTAGAEQWNGSRETNEAMLAGCVVPHRFTFLAQYNAETRTPSRYQCELCGGIVSGQARHWYNAGIRDGLRLRADREAQHEALRAAWVSRPPA